MTLQLTAQSLRLRARTLIRMLNAVIVRRLAIRISQISIVSDDRLLADIGLTRDDVRTIRPRHLSLRAHGNEQITHAL